MTLDLLSLNHDVLYVVLSFLNPPSALTLSMVSRKAYDIGLSHGLSSVTITRSQDQLRSFCKTMLGDRGVRLPYLRELTITSTAFGVARHIEFTHFVDFSAASELADLLESADRLRRLSISCLEALIEYEPRIATALEALPDLVDVSLHNCGERALSLLPRMCSKPRKLTFTQLFNRTTPALFERLGGLQGLDGLELAHLDIQTWPPTDSSDATSEDKMVQVPSLRALSVRGTKARMSSFVNAFPCLRSLSISDIYTELTAHDFSGDSEVCWPSLDRLRGNVPDFAHWRIACPVHWLELEQTMYHYPAALHVISCTNPVVLSLPVETRVGEAAFWGRFVEVVPRLRHLELSLEEGRLSHKTEEWMATIPQLLAILPIQSLSICIRPCTIPSPALTRVCYVTGSPPAPGTRTASALHALREHIARAIPSLQYVAITVAENRGRPGQEGSAGARAGVPFWWRVLNGSLERIPASRDFSPMKGETGVIADQIRQRSHSPHTGYRLRSDTCF